MINLVSRAIREAAEPDVTHTWEEAGVAERVGYELMARAAIKAMRESPLDDWPERTRIHFRCVMDAALVDCA